jgi:nucleoside-diphosphate-sugar epimerase
MSVAAVPAGDLARILRWCDDDWPALRGARILITGGTGFIGIWLLAALLEADRRHSLGLSLMAATRDPARFRLRAPTLAGNPALTLLAGDVRTLAPPPGAYTHVIHAATDASAKLNAERPLEMVSTIVDGTRRVLELARERGAGRLLFVSSGAVYGRQPADVARVAESHEGGPDPLHPGAAYGEAKRLAELLCAAAARASGLEVAIARLWAFVGPQLPLDAHFAVGNLIRDALAGGPLVVLGDGTTERSYLYAADLTAWLVRILVRGTPLRAYNVGSDEAVSIAGLAETVAAGCEPRPRIEIRGVRDPARAIDRYIPDTARARQELGLSGWTSLHDAIGMTIAWHRSAEKVAPHPALEGR